MENKEEFINLIEKLIDEVYKPYIVREEEGNFEYNNSEEENVYA